MVVAFCVFSNAIILTLDLPTERKMKFERQLIGNVGMETCQMLCRAPLLPLVAYFKLSRKEMLRGSNPKNVFFSHFFQLSV